MGTCFGKQSATEKAVPPAAQEAPKEKPRPMIFALMRNGHEVIRGAQRDLKASVEKGDLKTSKETWEKLTQWSEMHMKMEEGSGTGTSPIGMFKLLDEKFDGIATKGGLFDEHHTLEDKEKALDKALADGNMATVKTAFAAFEEENLAHLKKEEGIMMPKVSEMAKTGHDLKKYMKEELLAMIVDSPDFEFFVKFANDVLERHPENMPRVRVFDHALWAVATPEQWAVWDQWIKDTVSEKSYKELHDVIEG